MKHFLILLMCVLVLPIKAQEETRVQHFEVEAFLGGTIPVTGYKGLAPQISLGKGLEMRYNFQSVPLAIGFLAAQNETWYKRDDEYPHGQDNSMALAALSGEWNFKQGRKVNPYAGLSIGISSLTAGSGFGEYDEIGCRPVFIPRIGLELGYHFRTHLDFHVVRRGFSNVQLTVGAVIGGRPKKASISRPRP